ncbi:hypothetical protein [Candidatus Viridilinea mediisalina]|uniref:Uncharacterized protein n=1 Tax=Candidatus Viridilinea mediisalina TaxID=2024553 RepID=A0A2A6RLI0_9CHLR|nr:hypothetical protein [Candidatus Viridilinea mediisalina]PDW03756.1 hypothetical protein CJ255_07195 [Candidatus Viridilinea mediisalina]
MSTAAVALPAAPPLAIPEDPQAPFGVIALPDPTLLVTDAGIARAYAALCAHYHVAAAPEEREKAVRPIGAQLDKALALVLDRERWTLHDDHVALLGSEGDRYRTTPAFCEGPAWVSRGRKMTVCKGSLNARVGMCNHQLAVELLRLAQQLDHPLTPVFATDPAPTALVALPGWAIFALWGPITIAQRKGADAPESVELLMEESYLSLTGGGFATTTTCELSGAHTLIAIPVEGFQKLWEAIRPHAMETPTLTLAVEISDDTTGILKLQGGPFDHVVSVTGVVL